MSSIFSEAGMFSMVRADCSGQGSALIARNTVNCVSAVLTARDAEFSPPETPVYNVVIAH